MPNWRWLTLLSGLAVSLAITTNASGIPRGTLTVLQVEAPDAYGRFAPVDFGQGREVRADGALAGLRVTADSVTSTDGRDAGSHARQVAEALAGVEAIGGASVAHLRVMNSGDFLSRVLRPVQRSGRAMSPARLPGRPQVVNASFSGSSGWDGLDQDLLRRADQVVFRDGTVLVAGAVTAPNGPFAGANLVWGGRNVLAVRGTASDSVFAPPGRLPGRRYPDLWEDATASLAAARVSSAVARLLDAARRTGVPRLSRPSAMRAILMASADRSSVPAAASTGVTGGVAMAGTWRAQQANGLDPLWGAGRLDPDAAERVLRSPLTAPTAVTSGNRASPSGGLRPRTWGAETGLATPAVKARGTVAVPFRLAESVAGLAAALAWELNPSRAGPALATLRLELFGVTLAPGGTASLHGAPLAWVSTAGENVALLSFGSLPAGDYAWVLRNESRAAVQPVLAWMNLLSPPVTLDLPPTLPPVPPNAGATMPPTAGLSPVPEPGAGLLAVLAGGVALVRPRRSA